MKRKILLFVCVFALLAVALSSCKKDCDHTFSEAWDSDANTHWHPATCPHGEIKDSLADHVDANEDGVCDVCDKEIGHIHTAEDNWNFDDDNHWKNATCSHKGEKVNFGLHVDENVDGSCDVCSGHVHNVNAAGYCKITGCGKKIREIDETKLEDLVPAVVSQSWLVNGGTIDYDFVGNSATSSDFEATKKDIVSFTYGKGNYTHVLVDSAATNGSESATSTLETWHQLSGDDETFGVVSENGGALALDISNADRLNGYYIALSTLAGGYGVESTLYALYEAAIGDTVDELIVTPDADENKVVFTYSYKTVLVNASDIVYGDLAGTTVYNVNFFEVKVTFTYSDDYALTSLIIEVDCYTNEPGTADGIGFLYDDVDIEYDPETDTFRFVEYNHETGEYVDSDRRVADVYTINVVQTLGERTEENPNPQSKFVPESFDLYTGIDDDGVLYDKYEGGTFKVNVRDIINLYVGNYYPTGTSLHFVANQVSFKVFKDGVEVENASDYENQIVVADFTFAGSQRSFFFIPKEDGAYRFEIYVLGKMTHSIDIHVGVVSEEYIELEDNQFAVKVTQAYEWSNEYVFTAPETGKFYFNLPAGVGFMDADGFDAAELTPETDDTPKPYYDYNGNQNEDGSFIPGSFSLDLVEGQEVRFYVMANQRGTYIITFVAI